MDIQQRLDRAYGTAHTLINGNYSEVRDRIRENPDPTYVLDVLASYVEQCGSFFGDNSKVWFEGYSKIAKAMNHD